MSRERLSLSDLIADPYGSDRKARAAGGIVDLESFGVGFMRYDQVRALFPDRRLHANFPGFLRTLGVTEGPFYEWMSMSPLNREGEDHQHWRNFMSRTFTPRSVERLRPFLRDAAHGLIDGFAARGECEFMAEFADPFPSLGLCELIGVPKEDRDRFRGWANTIGLGFSPLVSAHIRDIDDALTQLLAYTGQLAAARRAAPRDDLVSRIALLADEEGGLTDAEVRGAIAGLVFAGHETTKTQLGWTVAALSDRADLWEAVAGGSLAAADLVEEVLRFRPAAAAAGRLVTEPVRVDGESVEPQERAMLSIRSANHDESVYPHPHELDPAQAAEHPHLSFGHGPHHCLGAALARAELQEALVSLAARLHCPAVGEGATYKPPAGINGPETLPITFTARSG